MKITADRIEKVVGLYRPGLRYLRDAWMDYPTGRGLFSVEATEYTEGVNHLTEVGAQICVNQWGQAFFATQVDSGRFGGFEGMNFDDFLGDIKERVVIAESRKRLKRGIDLTVPFYGNFEVVEKRKLGKNYLFGLDFSLNDGAAVGELLVVLKGRQ